MSRIEYRKRVAFVNRKKELEYLNSYIQSESENILFLHGPKSSGKTTLLYKFLDDLIKRDKVEIKFLNLREVLLNNYKDFINVFFTVENKISKVKKYMAKASAGIFGIDEELAKKIALVEADPFIVMKSQLEEINQKGIKPIIIIDELQALQNIYMNGERQVIKELFNFFVAMTKESHLAHIIIGSSDGYFLEQVYNDSKLKKTSEFYEIDYLTKEDVWEWLTNLEKYSKIKDYTLTEQEIEKVWDTVGGSCWEIQSLLRDFFENEVEQVCEEYKIKMRSLIIDYATENNRKLKEQILKKFVDNQKLSKTAFDEDAINKMKDMVHNNILYYNPTTAEFYPQGKSLEWGIKMYFEEN